MAVSPETRAFVLELFDGLPEVSARPMMGGLAVYSRGQVFCLVALGERVFLKASGALAEALAAEGSERFAYTRRNGRVDRMNYWTLPDAALDDPDLARAWGRRALEAVAAEPEPRRSRAFP
ncbi:TfoX/Sxy family protein [Amaricoccus solimangrovi]|uniref:TfoX/Sxy family protein n=1 Tax=Amaricoccus solimangrovi TaxID=2589815 RepID=A0A501WNT3_9RHOB|nr:TfoX/Sxy family protein [Amaricoccus solimangrovi]TPE47386.1 TfoX/Sxy family protein [Amaricoccus solimangrovi]